MQPVIRILLIDDDEEDFMLTRDCLRQSALQLELEWTAERNEALAHMRANRFDAYLIDYRLGAEDGLELMTAAIAAGAQGPFILLTAYGDEKLILKAMKAGAADYLVKNEVDTNLLERSIRYVIQRKESEAERRKIEQLYRALARNLPQITAILFDTDLKILMAEGGNQELSGLNLTELTGLPVQEALAHTYLHEVNNIYAQVAAGQTRTAEITFGGRNYYIRANPIRNQADDVVGGMLVSQDVTELKNAEKRTIELALERERIDLLRRFIGDISHDFKTPLTTIKTNLYLMQRMLNSVDQDKMQHKLYVLERQAERLETLIEDMLDVCRLDDGLDGRPLTTLGINPLIQLLVEDQCSLIGQKCHHISLTLDPSNPCLIGDEEGLRRAFSHILLNAIQYTQERGEIAISTSRANGELVVEIRDNGIGIPANELGRIFSGLYRSDSARNTRTGNAGLGLTIARKTFENHNGRIRVRSTPGVGSTFTVYLPLRSCDTATSTTSLHTAAQA